MSWNGVTAWGFYSAQKVQEKMTPKDALVRGGFDFQVDKISAVHPETLDPIEDLYHTIRTDTREIVGTVGSQYAVYQHTEMFDLFGELVDDGEIEVIHALQYRNFRKIALVCRLPEHIEIAGEEVIPFIVGQTSHDGSYKRRIVTTPVRVVCANTLAMALSEADRVYETKHTKHAEPWTITDVREALQMSFKYTEELERFGNELLDIKVSDADFERFLSSLAPTPKESSKNTATRRENQREEIRSVYYNSDNLNNIRGTGWGTLNAVVEWADHIRDYRNADRRAEVALEGDPVNERAKKILLAMA